MAATRISDVITQAVLASYQVEDPITKSAIYQSGILTSNSDIDKLVKSGSNEFSIPFWLPLDSSTEPNYSNDNPADIAVPQKITSAQQGGRMAYLNEGFSAAKLVNEITQQDPTQAVVSRLNDFWMQQAQRRVIASATGIMNANVAQDGSDMVVDISNATPTDATKFNLGAFIDADATFGDHLDETGAIIVHRKVYTLMQKSQQIEFVPDPSTNINVPYYAGKRVIVDNGVPVVGTGAAAKYVSILFGRNAIAYGMDLPSNHTRIVDVEDQANGGGVETLWTRRNILLHPAGYKFTSAKITGNATETPAMSASWTDLANATNWKRVFHRQNVPMAFLVTNA